jgi:hypothetical protein
MLIQSGQEVIVYVKVNDAVVLRAGLLGGEQGR